MAERHLGKASDFVSPLAGNQTKVYPDAAIGPTVQRALNMGWMPDLQGVLATPISAITGQPNPFFSAQQREDFAKSPIGAIGKSVGPDLINAALMLGGIGELSLMMKALPDSLFTKSGVAKKTTEAVQKASEGKTPSTWSEFWNPIKDAVYARFGKSPEVTNALEKLELEKAPGLQGSPVNLPPPQAGGPYNVGNVQYNIPKVASGGMADVSEGTMSLPQQLEWRKQLGQRLGGGFFEKLLRNVLNPNQLSNKVQEAAREGISRGIHEAAPATQLYDKLYRAYSTPLGDVPSAIGKIGGAYLVSKLVPSSIKSTVKGAIKSFIE